MSRAVSRVAIGPVHTDPQSANVRRNNHSYRGSAQFEASLLQLLLRCGMRRVHTAATCPLCIPVRPTRRSGTVSARRQTPSTSQARSCTHILVDSSSGRTSAKSNGGQRAVRGAASAALQGDPRTRRYCRVEARRKPHFINRSRSSLDHIRDGRLSVRAGLPARAAFFCTRISLGVLPVQRLNACVKALASRYPRSHAIWEIGRSASCK
jgi:hypothetical protein